MEKRTHADRYKVSCCPEIMESFADEEHPWRESEAEVADGLAWGEEKARLLKWVRKQMRRRLTAKQRRCIELYYFKDLTYVEAGKKAGCSASSACRAVQRGLIRLRAAAKTDPPEHLKPRRRARRIGSGPRK